MKRLSANIVLFATRASRLMCRQYDTSSEFKPCNYSILKNADLFKPLDFKIGMATTPHSKLPLRGRVYRFSKSMEHCSEIIRVIELSSFEERDDIVNEILPHVYQLSMHPVGWEVVNKLIGLSTSEQYSKMFDTILCSSPAISDDNDIMENWETKFKTSSETKTIRLARNTNGFRILKMLLARGQQHHADTIIEWLDINQETVWDVINHEYAVKTMIYLLKNHRDNLERVLKLPILTIIGKHLTQACLEDHSSKFVLSILSLYSTPTILEIYRNLRMDLKTLLLNNNGRQVITKLLEKIEPSSQESKFISSVIMENFWELSQNYHCKKLLQHYMSVSTATEIKQLKQDLMERSVAKVIKDPSSILVVNFLVERMSQEDRQDIFQSLRGHILELSQDQWASFFLSDAIEKYNQVDFVMEELKDHIIQCSRDKFASFIILKSLVDERWRRVVGEAFNGKLVSEIDHCNKVIRHLFQKSSHQEKDKISHEICAQSLRLSFSATLHRLVLYTIDSSTLLIHSELLKNLKGSMRKMALDQHASNVLMTFYECSSDVVRAAIVDELLGEGPTYDFVRTLCNDPYGFRVIRCLLSQSSTQLQVVQAVIRSNKEVLQSTKYYQDIKHFL